MTPSKYLLTLMGALVGLLWTNVVLAVPSAIAGPHFGPLLTDPLVLIVSALIALAMAVTTLFIRLNTLFSSMDPSAPKPLVRPLFFVVAHVGGSFLGGVAGLILASRSGVDADSALLSVLMMSFLGSKGLEKLAERFMPITRLAPEGDRP